MQQERNQKLRVRILVKAFPQPSTKYEETVCVAAVSEDTREFLRLFPIRYRRLPAEHRFQRFDQVTLTATKATSDPRPESYRVDEPSIKVTGKSGDLSPTSKVALWSPFVSPSLSVLQSDQKQSGRSLGIIRPDAGSIRFKIAPLAESTPDDQEVASHVFEQASLLEDPLRPLAKPEFSFSYTFVSGGKQHTYQIHDWEVQAAFQEYQRRYGSGALAKMEEQYGQKIPFQNLHFIMGTMQKRPWQFIVIGLLRSSIAPEDLKRQQILI